MTDYDAAKRSGTAKFGQFHRRMLEQGIYLPPSQFEDVRKTADAVRRAS